MADDTGGFVFREARVEDKDEVVAFTHDTWEGHDDYIAWVYDSWVNEKDGCFMVAVDRASGKIAGIDKLRMLSPSEAWFEGIRVNPAFRGRGLSGLLQRRMLREAAARRARTVRFLTAPDNIPIHRIAYRDGFSMRFTARHWRWIGSEDEAPTDPTDDQIVLSAAAAKDASILHEWWRRSGCCFATGGMLDRGWVFAETSAEEWERIAAEGRLFVSGDVDSREAALPPPMLVVEPDNWEDEPLSWHISLACATGREWEQLARATLRLAREQRVAEMDGLLPDLGALNEGFAAVGMKAGDWESFVLFEKRL